jgi:hypothetical protein
VRVTFVRPNIYADRSRDALEPLVFALLAGLTPPDVECELFDERLEPLPEVLDTDLVAITAETYTARRAYQLATQYRRQGIPVVLGGYHPTFCPQEALQYARSVVLNDAEEVWPQIIADARRGRLQPIYQGGYPSLAERPLDRSIFQGKRYRPVALVQFGRGCRYACDFCSIHAFYGHNLRWRPVAEVVEELVQINRPYIFFADDNLFNDRARLQELLAAIRPLKLRWSCQASLDVAADRSLVRQLAESGCVSVMIGFESLDRDNLRQMRKSWNAKHGAYSELIRVLCWATITIPRGLLKPRWSSPWRTGCFWPTSTRSRRRPVRACTTAWRPRGACCTIAGGWTAAIATAMRSSGRGG